MKLTSQRIIVTKSKDTIRLEKAVDGARRIIKPEPMTQEEEYRNADVPMPKEPGKRFTEWLSEPVDDRGDLDLTKQIDVLKTQQDILIQKLDMAAHVVKQLEGRLLDKEKENDRLVEELQLAEIALNPAKKWLPLISKNTRRGLDNC